MSQQKQFTIQWKGYQNIATESFSIEVPSFNKENFSYTLKNGLQFVAQWETPSYVNESSIQINKTSYVQISKTALKGVDLKTIPNKITYTLKNSIARNKRFAYLSVSPIIKDAQGVYKKLVSFSVAYNLNRNALNINNNNRVITNSALSSGAWYRFYVEESGVY
ncbi:MAG: peptidase C25, partial [Oceanihabitans sp.]